MGARSSARKSTARRSAERQQVAAVCYRMGPHGIEFLLVQTRAGRWIFPKGGVASGLTHAQSAALEAFEEAGVHGRMEQIPFTRYFRPGLDKAPKKQRTSNALSHPAYSVPVYLCEVTRLESPQESNRHPTWLSAEKAKRRLKTDRAADFAAELARVVDRALSRIHRLRVPAEHAIDHAHRDALQQAHFEAPTHARWRELASRHGAPLAAGAEAQLMRMRAIAAAELRPVLRLGSGLDSSAEKTDNVTAINGARAANSSKPAAGPPRKR